jgi:hypothetical protein
MGKREIQMASVGKFLHEYFGETTEWRVLELEGNHIGHV